MADDGLAYGDYHGHGSRSHGDSSGGGSGDNGSSGGYGSGGGSERGLFSGALNKLKTQEGRSGLFGKLSGAVQDIGNELAGRLQDVKVGTQAVTGSEHRFGSFAQPRVGNDIKWFVDGCGYFHAVSEALSHAQESIWILDWWLSPELYLRRPPAKNEQYRLDRMLKAAAERGVQVNIIVYKEVEQALTLSSVHTKHALEALHPNIKVFRHPDHAPDAQTFISSLKSSVLSAQTLVKLPEDTVKAVYGINEDVILYWAHHEKLCIVDGKMAFMGGLDLCYGRWDTNQHSISDVHPENLDNIIFPGQDYNNARIMDFQNVSQPENNKLDRTKSSRMGWSDVSICLRGPVLADLEAHFVQRWNFIYFLKYDVRKDARYAPILLQGAPGAPGPLLGKPGHSARPGSQQSQQGGQQARPSYPEEHQYQSSEQQPQELAGSQPGTQSGLDQGSQPYFPPPPSGQPPRQDEQNFPPPPPGGPPQQSSQHYPPPPAGGPSAHSSEQYFPPPPSGAPPHSQATQDTPYFPPPPGASESSRGVEESDRGLFSGRGSSSQDTYGLAGSGRLHGIEEKGFAMADKVEGRLKHAYHDYSRAYAGRQKTQHGTVACQLTRSAARWSNGTPLEHSVQNAYISAIESSQHFIYIENQFFITATSSKQAPVKNRIGAAIVNRILRAARAGQKYKVVVVIPSVPGFAGDLRDDSSLGTRAIMEFQYNSINRGGYSIMEEIDRAGFNPMEYIRFYNLRNYDRINDNKRLRDMEKQIGISYEAARREADDLMDPIGRRAQDGSDKNDQPASYDNYKRFQTEAGRTLQNVGRWDSVAECYMLGGTDIRDVPWDGDAQSEMNAFVSEELYIHSKVMIADDRIAICGSANLNDRSQLGDHDSEIALVIEDQEPLDSYMNGHPWRAGKFAATLRRQLFRKHLGLIRPQQAERPDRNFQPVGVPNEYDYGSPEDHLVQDPLADTFLNFWNSRAKRNTDAFRKLFRPVPDDSVLTWNDYATFYERYFHDADEQAEGKKEGVLEEGEAAVAAVAAAAAAARPSSSSPSPSANREAKGKARYEWGHVVAEEFRPGAEGVAEMKEWLAQIKGTLVEMPLRFLIKEDIAKTGLALNAITEPIYT